jgi:hypothetical protein
VVAHEHDNGQMHSETIKYTLRDQRGLRETTSSLECDGNLRMKKLGNMGLKLCFFVIFAVFVGDIYLPNK